MVVPLRQIPGVTWLLVAAAGAQDFVAVPGPAPNVCQEIVIGPDLRFRIVGGSVVVVRGERTEPMPATSPTGVVHELARVPAGTVVAACEQGLFVCDREHLVLDAADLRDGVPAGSVLGVAADARGRVWCSTAAAFGVIDLRWRFGRVFTEPDGLPAGPFTRVAVAPDGRVLLDTAGGVFAYQPDVGPAPQLVGGPRETEPLAAAADGSLALPVTAEARGGATFRLRRRHHHLLVPFDGTLTGLRPGRHFLELHAVDRDLRVERVAEYTVDVPVPPQFDLRLVPAVLAAFVAALLAIAFVTGGGGSPRTRWARAALRAGVLVVVLLQVAAAFAGYGRSWPFAGFSMYTENWHRDDVLYRPRIVGLRADGGRTPLHEDDLGVMQDGYWQELAEVVFGPARHRERLFEQVKRRAGAGSPFVGYTLADGRIRLTGDGPVDVAPTVLLEYRP